MFVPVISTPVPVVSSLLLLLWYKFTAPPDINWAWITDKSELLISVWLLPKRKLPSPSSVISEWEPVCLIRKSWLVPKRIDWLSIASKTPVNLTPDELVSNFFDPLWYKSIDPFLLATKTLS